MGELWRCTSISKIKWLDFFLMSENIQFYTEGEIIHPFPQLIKNYIQWLLLVLNKENKSIINLTYIFFFFEYLIDLNQKHLGHDYYTDIITFPYQQGDLIESDMFISVDRVKENAIEFCVPYETELRRVMVHGLLHLMGYGDKTEEEILIMRRKEDAYIDLWSEK